MPKIEFKSPIDGAVLSFEKTESRHEEVRFMVAIVTPIFSGVAPASTYVSGSPSTMFRQIANEWKGWKDSKTWDDLEGRVSFSATSDSTGHIFLAVELVGEDYESRLRVVLKYEAGQLEKMADKITALLG